MTEREVKEILNKIIAAMDLVRYRDTEALKQYSVKLENLLVQLPVASYSSIIDFELKEKILTIWQRSFSKYQGRTRKGIPILGCIDIAAKRLMIEHGFYVDLLFKKDFSILFKIYSLLQTSLIRPIIEQLLKQKLLEKAINIQNNNIFTHIEKDLIPNLKEKKPKLSKIRLRSKKDFALELITVLKEHNLSHGFSEEMNALLGLDKIKVLESNDSEDLPPLVGSLLFSSFAHFDLPALETKDLFLEEENSSVYLPTPKRARYTIE